jgi:hypothetical protein
MDIIFVLVVIVVVVYIFIAPFVCGLTWFFGGLDFLLNFDPDFDERKKKGSAILDLILGTALLLFQSGMFWLVVWPLIVMYYNLNLPTFSWLFE